MCMIVPFRDRFEELLGKGCIWIQTKKYAENVNYIANNYWYISLNIISKSSPRFQTKVLFVIKYFGIYSMPSSDIFSCRRESSNISLLDRISYCTVQ